MQWLSRRFQPVRGPAAVRTFWCCVIGVRAAASAVKSAHKAPTHADPSSDLESRLRGQWLRRSGRLKTQFWRGQTERDLSPQAHTGVYRLDSRARRCTQSAHTHTCTHARRMILCRPHRATSSLGSEFEPWYQGNSVTAPLGSVPQGGSAAQAWSLLATRTATRTARWRHPPHHRWLNHLRPRQHWATHTMRPTHLCLRHLRHSILPRRNHQPIRPHRRHRRQHRHCRRSLRDGSSRSPQRSSRLQRKFRR